MHDFFYSQIRIFLGFCFLMFMLPKQQAYGFTDSSKVYHLLPVLAEDSTEAAADFGKEETLEQIRDKVPKLRASSKKMGLEVHKKYMKNYVGHSLQKKLSRIPKPSTKQKNLNSSVTHGGSKYRINQQKIKQQRQKRGKKYRRNSFWKILGNLLDLDWITVGIVVLLPAILIALIYFLAGGTALTFIQMFFFALGFGFALFSYIFLLTEYTAGQANYEYFVRYGFATWPGILAIIAGFVALFGGTGGSFFGYLLVGLVLGAISFLLSLLFKKHFFNRLK